MAVNPYFNNFNSVPEQKLMEDLIIESIKQYGHDVWYMPRTIDLKNEIFDEPQLQTYNAAHPIEVFIKNVGGWAGEGKFLSKFGLEVRDEVTFCISIRRWRDDVGSKVSTLRPNEGDLIYFPMVNKCFQMSFTNHEAIYYQFGALPMYELQTELFEFSGERFNTGNAIIDNLYTNYSFDPADHNIPEEDFDIDEIDKISDNTDIQSEADEVLSWDEKDPFSEGGRY